MIASALFTQMKKYQISPGKNVHLAFKYNDQKHAKLHCRMWFFILFSEIYTLDCHQLYRFIKHL